VDTLIDLVSYLYQYTNTSMYKTRLNDCKDQSFDIYCISDRVARVCPMSCTSLIPVPFHVTTWVVWLSR